MARPKGDLASLSVPKGDALPAELHTAKKAKAYEHSLSLRLTAEDYRDLRRYTAEQEERTGNRLTHQALIEGLLLTFLADHKKQ